MLTFCSVCELNLRHLSAGTTEPTFIIWSFITVILPSGAADTGRWKSVFAYQGWNIVVSGHGDRHSSDWLIGIHYLLVRLNIVLLISDRPPVLPNQIIPPLAPFDGSSRLVDIVPSEGLSKAAEKGFGPNDGPCFTWSRFTPLGVPLPIKAQVALPCGWMHFHSKYDWTGKTVVIAPPGSITFAPMATYSLTL